MEDKVIRGRGGGGWRRGGRGGSDSDGFSGEHRGRGRGVHHRGRGRRDFYRGRGRWSGAHAEESSVPDQTGGDNLEETETSRSFSRRKLESNWDRYTESEQPDQEDDIPIQRGTDYHALLGSAGDSFSQFRFAEEKDWEMDAFMASQMSIVNLDLPALALCLKQIPVHERLGLEAEMDQVSTPEDLPAIAFPPKKGTSKSQKFTSPAFKKPNGQQYAALTTRATTHLQDSSAEHVDEDEDELDQLLGLKLSDSEVKETEPVALETTPDIVEEVKEVTCLQPASTKKEMTEEDLEDWLDSMIS